MCLFVSEKPTGVMIPTHLKVMTIVERPFVYIKNITGVTDAERSCDTGWYNCPEYVPQQNSSTSNATDGEIIYRVVEQY